ncbi:LOW QUALITY PROTEIN: hypothetical protein CRUP_007399 [Coryphaenoides rupestris]|nr:LOW QUALITY PROTEIN: hypothetical protein CRUP_007399 [Coryphaenoides rupestris]
MDGMRCANLEEPQALMKMGLSVILIGHVNFLLGALVHGAVLRHINLHKQARAMEYSISNVMALASGLLTWTLFSFSLLASLTGPASAVSLLLSAIVNGGRSLLTHCRFPDAIGYSSITNECPFDPTRIYSTTLVLWVPLVATCLVQMIDVERTEESADAVLASTAAAPPRYTPPPCYAPPPSRPPLQQQQQQLQQQQQQQQHQTQRQQQQQYLARQYRSLPPSERQPLYGPPRRARPEHRPPSRTETPQERQAPSTTTKGHHTQPHQQQARPEHSP